MQQKRQDLRKAIELELEQARYEARLAARRYESVDPEQRLVAADLVKKGIESMTNYWGNLREKISEPADLPHRSVSDPRQSRD